MKRLIALLCICGAIVPWSCRDAEAAGDANGLHVICLSSLPKRPDWQRIIKRILDLDYVDGLLVYVDWQRLEPEPGRYDWQFFDVPLKLAHQRGKTAAFVLIVETASPAWLMARCRTFTFEHPHPSVGTVTAPVPWDPDYKAALVRTVRAVAGRYDGRPGLLYVNINGPSSLFGVETNFPVKRIAPDEAARLGYTHEKFKAGWMEMTDVFSDAFPHTRLALGLHHQLNLGEKDRGVRLAVVRAIRDHAIAREARHHKRLIVRLLGLAPPNPNYFAGPPAPDGSPASDYTALAWEARDRADVAFEAARIFRYSNVGGRQQPLTPDEFRQALDVGLSYHPNWLEIKWPDVWDPRTNGPFADYVEPLRHAHRRLTAERPRQPATEVRHAQDVAAEPRAARGGPDRKPSATSASTLICLAAAQESGSPRSTATGEPAGSGATVAAPATSSSSVAD